MIAAVPQTDRCLLCRSPGLKEVFHIKCDRYVWCSDCSLVYREEISSTKEKALYSSDAYYQEQSGHRLQVREATFRQSLNDIERIKRPGRLLDVGCGDGAFLHLARARGWQTHGVEISPAACQQATALGLEIVQGELMEAGFRDSFFDVVTLHNVLDHLPDPLVELREIRRILKPGGLLFIRVPNGAFHVGLLRISRRFERYLVFHPYCFTPKAIRRCLELAEYTHIRVANAVLTPADPYGISPIGRDTGIQLIKWAVYAISQIAFYLSARAIIIGPSLKVLAAKP